MKSDIKDLFGGSAKWHASDWTASDDRVRGGKSQSYLEIDESGTKATFKGNLDIKTLGGAGFASQRTASDDASWDLSDYDGIEIVIAESDDKRYTFNIKDELLPRDPDTGREQSTISYEYDFTITSSDVDSRRSEERRSLSTLWIPWSKLTPTYRGREKKDAPELKKNTIRRFGIMCRSFFGDQEGDFELEIERISAVKMEKKGGFASPMEATSVAENHDEKSFEVAEKSLADVERGDVSEGDRHLHQGPSRRSKLAMLALGIMLLVNVWIAFR